MDCKTARLLLDFARPRATELEEEDGKALAGHLAECSACAAAERTERRFDEPIARAMQDVPVPPELRGRLLQRLGAQRDSWYRRRVWPALAAAAAAAVLLWTGIRGFYQPVEPDLVRLQEEINQVGPALAVAQWLARHDGQEPPGFNPALLMHSGIADFQGKQVPLLEYRQGPDQAWVYVLHDRDFNVKSLAAEQAHRSGRYSIEVRTNPDDPHTAYVVIYTGPDLTPFMHTSVPAT